MPRSLKLWLLALSLLVAGCSPVEVAWDREISSGVTGEIVIAVDRIFLGTGRNHLVCLDLVTGQTVWDTPLPLPLVGRPAVEGESVFVSAGSAEGAALLALSLETGQVVWRQELPPGITAPAAAAGSVVVTASGIQAYQGDGRRLWRTSLGLGKKPGPPAVAQDRAVIGTDQRSLVALDLFRGEPAWQRQLEGPVLGAPCVVVDRLVVATPKTLSAYRLADGGPLWTSAFGGEVTCGSEFLLARSNDTLTAVEAATGRVRWTVPSRGSAAVAAAEQIVLGLDSTLTGLDPSDGKVLWEYRAGAPLAAPPAVGQGWVVAATDDGVLFALQQR